MPAGVLGVPVSMASWAFTPDMLNSSGDASWSEEERRRALEGT